MTRLETAAIGINGSMDRRTNVPHSRLSSIGHPLPFDFKPINGGTVFCQVIIIDRKHPHFTPNIIPAIVPIKESLILQSNPDASSPEE